MEFTQAEEKYTVLVIDDDPQFRELVVDILTERDFEVVSAPDGPSGMELARAAQPDVILLDMVMPGLDGIATCSQLKGDAVVADIPVVGVTSSPELNYTAQAFRAGAELFLTKPCRANNLVHVLDLAAKGKHGAGGARAFPRFLAELLVRCRVAGDAETSRDVAGRTGNVSFGGVLLHLPESLPPGTVVRLHLGFSGGYAILDGTVAWRGPQLADTRKSPHGIRFLRFVEHTDFERYRRFLAEMAGRFPECEALRESLLPELEGLARRLKDILGQV
jgi:CheY-like chemotaxis protein